MLALDAEESTSRQPNGLYRTEKVKQISLRPSLIYDPPFRRKKNGYHFAVRKEVEQDVLAGQASFWLPGEICLLLFVVLYVKD